MLSYKESLKILKETDALLEGHFILSSGLHSEKYIQCAQLLSKPKKAKFFYIIIITIIVSVVTLIFNDFGFLKLVKLQRQHQALDSSLRELLLQQEKLKLEINQLQTNNAYIEKIAREKFMMVLPGEKVYRVQEIKNY